MEPDADLTITQLYHFAFTLHQLIHAWVNKHRRWGVCAAQGVGEVVA